MAATLEVTINVLDLTKKRVSVWGHVTNDATGDVTSVGIANTIYDAPTETLVEFQSRVATILWLQYQAAVTRQDNIDTILEDSEAAIKTLFDTQGA
jgi:hypothetical protein